jgi:hypothetical protein
MKRQLPSAGAASDSLSQNGAGLLARHDLDELLKMVLDGVTPREVRDRFETVFPNGGFSPRML